MLPLYSFLFNIISIWFFFLYNLISLLFVKILFYPTGIYLSILLICWIYYMLLSLNYIIFQFFKLIIYYLPSAVTFPKSYFLFLFKHLKILWDVLNDLLYFFSEYRYIFLLKRAQVILLIFFFILII